jgi:16S rRNA (uracil1498-N3)-methyltransferase
MPPRFYAPDLNPSDETIALDEDEATHLVRVLRLQTGAEVAVFNGRGVERRAKVELADKRGVVLRVVEAIEPAPELAFPLTLAQAVLKSDGMDEVVRNAVMLGVTRIVPLLTQHAEVSAAQIARTFRVDRWTRVAVSSAKQCGRAVVPGVSEPVTFEALLTAEGTRALVLVEPRAPAEVTHVRDLPADTPAAGATVVVGPEGGWSPKELQIARDAGATLVTLGALTLRADSAAATAIPVLRYVWKAL